MFHSRYLMIPKSHICADQCLLLLFLLVLTHHLDSLGAWLSLSARWSLQLRMTSSLYHGAFVFISRTLLDRGPFKPRLEVLEFTQVIHVQGTNRHQPKVTSGESFIFFPPFFSFPATLSTKEVFPTLPNIRGKRVGLLLIQAWVFSSLGFHLMRRDIPQNSSSSVCLGPLLLSLWLHWAPDLNSKCAGWAKTLRA